MAPHGTVTTSSSSAGQKKTGRKSNGNNGNTLPFVLKKTAVEPRALKSFGSDESSEKEILFRITDYFDSSDGTNGAGSYWYGLNNDLFSANYGDAYQKIHSVDLYALPAFGLATDASSELLLFGVPIAAGGVGPIRNAAQQTTLLIPTSVSKWVKVGSWKASALLADTTTGLILTGTDPNQAACLFSWACCDPDTIATRTTTGVQFKVVIKVKQSLPLRTSAKGAVEYSSAPNWTSPDIPGTLVNVFCQVEALSLNNSI